MTPVALALGLSLDMTELLAVILTIFFSLAVLVALDRWWER